MPNLTVIGESSLDRIARSLGGNTVLKAIAPRIGELLQANRTWQEKRAALLALSAIAEGKKPRSNPKFKFGTPVLKS